jgi:hypothetical protein
MSLVSRTTSKGYLNTGDTPTETQFSDTLDSVIWYDDIQENPQINVFKELGASLISEPVNCRYGDVGTSPVAAVDGSLRLQLHKIYRAATITGVRFFQATQGVYTADNNNKVAMYSVNTSTMIATLVGSSTNDGNLFKAAANTAVLTPFTSTYAASPGFYYVGALWNASATTTAPTVHSANSTDSQQDWGFSNSMTLSFNISGQTDLPATIDLTSGSINRNSLRQYFATY